MKTLKRMMVAVLAMLALTAGTAVADTDHGYSRMFVFGASFLDPGNNFALTGETAHPPFEPISFISYGIGGHHYSNGRTWVEVMAQDMELTAWAKPAFRNPAFGNYAYGYARARPVDNPLGPSLGDQVQAWIDNGYCTGIAMNDTLFVLDASWFDMFDILQGGDPTEILPGIINSIGMNIGILRECGARNLLVANIPPIGTSPLVPDADKAAATALSALFNYVYLQTVIDFYSGSMNISTVDVFDFFTQVVMGPEEFGLTNITDTCVTPGVLVDAFCKDRDGYFFWDALHPTKAAHAALAEYALDWLPVPE